MSRLRTMLVSRSFSSDSKSKITNFTINSRAVIVKKKLITLKLHNNYNIN